MIEFEATLRKWGRSLGMVIPNNVVVKEKLKEGVKVKVTLSHNKNPLRETFGKVKLKESTDKIMREVDKELWDE